MGTWKSSHHAQTRLVIHLVIAIEYMININRNENILKFLRMDWTMTNVCNILCLDGSKWGTYILTVVAEINVTS